MAESEEELKNLLMKVKEENEKAGLKFNIKKKKKPTIMYLVPSLKANNEENMETGANFIF